MNDIIRNKAIAYNGRVHFVDMEQEKVAGKDYDTRQRLVDPRTINFIIVNNVKYQLK